MWRHEKRFFIRLQWRFFTRLQWRIFIRLRWRILHQATVTNSSPGYSDDSSPGYSDEFFTRLQWRFFTRLQWRIFTRLQWRLFTRLQWLILFKIAIFLRFVLTRLFWCYRLRLVFNGNHRLEISVKPFSWVLMTGKSWKNMLKGICSTFKFLNFAITAGWAFSRCDHLSVTFPCKNMEVQFLLQLVISSYFKKIPCFKKYKKVVRKHSLRFFIQCF